jgi:DNA-binding GntR family transcriptional regulator
MKMAETKDIIDALSDGDNLGAEKAFKDTIQSKVADALETKRKEVANTFVKSSVTQDEGDGEEV